MVLPAMVAQWIADMANPNNNFSARQNKYMMLEHMNRVVADELRKYELELKGKK